MSDHLLIGKLLYINWTISYSISNSNGIRPIARGGMCHTVPLHTCEGRGAYHHRTQVEVFTLVVADTVPVTSTDRLFESLLPFKSISTTATPKATPKPHPTPAYSTT